MPLASLWSSLSLLTPRPAAPSLRRATFSSWLLGGPIRLCGARSKAAYRNAIPHYGLPTPPQRLNVPQVSTTSPGRHHRTITLSPHPTPSPTPPLDLGPPRHQLQHLDTREWHCNTKKENQTTTPDRDGREQDQAATPNGDTKN